MAEKYWFKARKKGVGWTPSTWQGWIVLALYIGLLVHSFSQVNTLFSFFPRFLIFTALLIIVTYLKGEPTTWHHHPDHVKPSEALEKE